MILLYRLFFIPAMILALPVYLPRMLRRGGYVADFSQRFGIWRGLSPKSSDVRRIWIHAVSVGEILALKPLIHQLHGFDERLEIVLTTTTSTAYQLAARELSPKVAYLAYFPLDFWFFSRRAWERVQPDACILMEAELWPEHLHQAKVRNVPVFLINARMSERSFKRWRRMPAGVRGVFRMLRGIVAASDEDGRRFVDLGACEDRVVVSGNLKLDFDPTPMLDHEHLTRLRRELGFHELQGEGSAPFILAGASTWPGEEEMLLRVWEKLRLQDPRCRLLLVPRHAERRNQLKGLFAQSGWLVHFRSDGAATRAMDVTVADTTGEMVRLLQVADAVFVGKSMALPQGGQNPIEAAALGKAVLFGPNMQNFQAVTRSMLDHGAAIQVNNEEELVTHSAHLLGDSAFRKEQSAKARKWHETGKGATERTFAVLRDALRWDVRG